MVKYEKRATVGHDKRKRLQEDITFIFSVQVANQNISFYQTDFADQLQMDIFTKHACERRCY